MKKLVTAFISYSSQNEAEKMELEKRLQSVPGLAVWSDKELKGGDERLAVIREKIKNSDILLNLVSEASITSKWCGQEWAVAQKFKIRIVSIILEKCRWKSVEIFNENAIYLYSLSAYTVFPANALPISEWEDRNEALKSVVDGVHNLVRKHTQTSSIFIIPDKLPPRDECMRIEKAVARDFLEKTGYMYCALTPKQKILHQQRKEFMQKISKKPVREQEQETLSEIRKQAMCEVLIEMREEAIRKQKEKNTREWRNLVTSHPLAGFLFF